MSETTNASSPHNPPRPSLTPAEACAAAIARLQGRFDDPALKKWGHLTAAGIDDAIDILSGAITGQPPTTPPWQTVRVQRRILHELVFPAGLALDPVSVARYLENHGGFPAGGEWQPLEASDILPLDRDPPLQPKPAVIVHLEEGILADVVANFRDLTVLVHDEDDQGDDPDRWRVEEPIYDPEDVERALIEHKGCLD